MGIRKCGKEHNSHSGMTYRHIRWLLADVIRDAGCDTHIPLLYLCPHRIDHLSIPSRRHLIAPVAAFLTIVSYVSQEVHPSPLDSFYFEISRPILFPILFRPGPPRLARLVIRSRLCELCFKIYSDRNTITNYMSHPVSTLPDCIAVDVQRAQRLRVISASSLLSE